MLAIAPHAIAQDTYWGPQVGPSIAVIGGGVPATNLSDAAGQRYGFSDVGIRATVPVIGGWDWDNEQVSNFRLLVHAGFSADSAILPYTPGHRELYALDAGVSGVHILNPTNQLTWSLSSGFAEDDTSISSPKARVTGRLVGVHRTNKSLTLIYGGAYSFVLGRGRPLPVFGVLWRPHPGTTVSVLGPFAGHLHQRVGRRLIVGAQAGLRGNQYHIAANEQFSSATNSLYLRVREVRLGGEAGVILNRSVALLGEAGVATARNLTFADGKTKLSSFSVGAQPYVSITLRYSFSRQGPWEDLGRW
jgi:hypothetical protein